MRYLCGIVFDGDSLIWKSFYTFLILSEKKIILINDVFFLCLYLVLRLGEKIQK